MSNADPRASGGATYRMLRELGARSQPSYAAIREPHELVMAQTFVRHPVPGATLDAEAMALLLRDARCLAKQAHANIAPVLHLDLKGPGLTVATAFIDGATLEDLLAAPLPLPVLGRVLLDVLEGLSALHALRDGLDAPLGAIHGELRPANIVVGADGVTRIVDVLRPRPVRPAPSSSNAMYAAPEALEGEGTRDPRSDVYAVGVILAQAISGRSRPELTELAMQASAFTPGLRFNGAAEMAAELCEHLGGDIALASAVAAHVNARQGARIRMRRAVLDPAKSGTQRRVSRLRASPRVPAPTVSAFVPYELMALARGGAGDEPALANEEELPGPRGSSPDLDLESVMAAARDTTSEPPRLPAITPITPNVPLPRSVLPAPAVVCPPAQTATETPGELEVPVFPSRSPTPRSYAVFLLMAALVVIAAGASLAMRLGTSEPTPAGLMDAPPAAVTALPALSPDGGGAERARDPADRR